MAWRRPLTRIGSLLSLSAASLAGAAEPQPRFEAQTLDAKVQIGYGVAIGDVDGDAKPDVLLADKKQFLWYRNPGKRGEAWTRHVMAENLTALDNVCIAARDIDGDGKVEVAVGAMWNPGETNDPAKSGSVHHLIRPADPTQPWTPVALHHEVTVHRMRWLQIAPAKHCLIVLPLHGKGNKNGQGEGVKVLAYHPPANPSEPWRTQTLDDSMHLTHNLDVVQLEGDRREGLLIAGKEGLRGLHPAESAPRPIMEAFRHPSGEARAWTSPRLNVIAAIEPMHGNRVVVYHGDPSGNEPVTRAILDETLKEGHALAVADFMGLGQPQVVAGWRNPNQEKKVGLRMYTPNADRTGWERAWIDENGMACEDLAVGDLDGDGRLDLVASGRATKNLKVYWNHKP